MHPFPQLQLLSGTSPPSLPLPVPLPEPEPEPGPVEPPPEPEPEDAPPHPAALMILLEKLMYAVLSNFLLKS